MLPVRGALTEPWKHSLKLILRLHLSEPASERLRGWRRGWSSEWHILQAPLSRCCLGEWGLCSLIRIPHLLGLVLGLWVMVKPSEGNPEYSLEGLIGILIGRMLKLKLQYYGHLMWRADSLEKTLMLEKLKTKGEEGGRGWDDWIASLTRCT